ncbi:unnamed protein product [Polarella glacialis]|uniref:Uncharacterized protein n=1 Tax=Polarella glacialis TaxID=89957 RepID=A0A813DF72_POLGL|nr:unnamed protein product [Polarella glacialis]
MPTGTARSIARTQPSCRRCITARGQMARAPLRRACSSQLPVRRFSAMSSDKAHG